MTTTLVDMELRKVNVPTDCFVCSCLTQTLHKRLL